LTSNLCREQHTALEGCLDTHLELHGFGGEANLTSQGGEIMKKTMKLILAVVLALGTVVATGYTLHSASANGGTVGPGGTGGGTTFP
jgi:hypothetical protein